MKNYLFACLLAFAAVLGAVNAAQGPNCDKCCKDKSCKECCGDDCSKCEKCN